MKRLAIVLVLLLALPAAAQADWAKPWEREYLNAYERAHDRGYDTGRNLLDCAWLDVKCVPRPRIEESTARLKRWLSPPPPAAAPAPSTSEAPASSGGGYAIPEQIVRCESGGDYSAVNPSSGAGGAYQFMPSTWRGLGYSGRPQDAPPAVQDQAAAKLWAGGAGRGNWEC